MEKLESRKLVMKYQLQLKNEAAGKRGQRIFKNDEDDNQIREDDNYNFNR